MLAVDQVSILSLDALLGIFAYSCIIHSLLNVKVFLKAVVVVLLIYVMYLFLTI